MTSGIIKTIITIVLISVVGADVAQSKWLRAGIPICQYESIKGPPYLVSDGSGGIFTIWNDDRSGLLTLYMQRVGPYGDLKWDEDGIPVCVPSGVISQYHALSDSAGGAFLTWTEEISQNRRKVYIQRINSDGDRLWESNGTPICSVSRFQLRSRLVSDGAGGVFVIWEDRQYDTTLLFVQRFNGNGARMWGDAGVNISGEPISAGSWNIHACNGCGATAVWITSSGVDGAKICTQLIDGDGSLPWGTEIDVVYSPYSFDGFSSCWNPGGGNYVTWIEEDRFDIVHKIYGQKIGVDGSLQWGESGVLADSLHIQCNQLRNIPSGDSNVFILWGTAANPNFRQYAQIITGDGATPLGIHGQMVAYTATSQENLGITTDGDGGVISIWSENRDPAITQIFAQHFDSYGNVLWPITGLRVCPVESRQICPDILTDGKGGAFLTWIDDRSGQDLYGLRIDSEGDPVPCTILLDYSAYISGKDVVVEWTLEEAAVDLEFTIYRAAQPDSVFIDIEDPFVSGTGLSFSFRDRNAVPSTTYRYRINVQDEEPERMLFITGPVTTTSQPLTIEQSYPNPFTSYTDIRYYLPSSGLISLGIYDIKGRIIRKLVHADEDAGYHDERWDGCDDSGTRVPPGIYFLRLNSKGNTEARKIALMPK